MPLILQPKTGRSLKFKARLVEKPWGRHAIPEFFGCSEGRRVGEIWFEHPQPKNLPLLVKYIFTSENLSVQVHPNNEEARERGLRQGKSECWYVIDAEPSARIGVGLRSSLSPAELREAALDGSIEEHMDWKPVTKNDFFFVPAGTIHAIGAGITLLELQQNVDVTYRLYDYGRPRELHLDDAVAVAKPEPYPKSNARRAAGEVDTVLLDGPLFSLIRASSAETIPASLSGRLRWVMPLEGRAIAEGESAAAGECLLVQPHARLSLSESAVVLVGAENAI